MLFDLVIPLWRYSQGKNPKEGAFFFFYKDIHSSTIYKSEKLEITQISNREE